MESADCELNKGLRALKRYNHHNRNITFLHTKVQEFFFFKKKRTEQTHYEERLNIIKQYDRIESKHIHINKCGRLCLLNGKIFNLIHKDPTICFIQETYPKQNDAERLKIKGQSKVFQANGNTKKAKTATLISDKIESKQVQRKIF